MSRTPRVRRKRKVKPPPVRRFLTVARGGDPLASLDPAARLLATVQGRARAEALAEAKARLSSAYGSNGSLKGTQGINSHNLSGPMKSSGSPRSKRTRWADNKPGQWKSGVIGNTSGKCLCGACPNFEG